MIHTNELMLGNWVLYKDKPIEVEGIMENSLCLFENKIGVRKAVPLKSNEIEPIPITEELLKKCGFKEFRRRGGFVAYSDNEYEYGDVLVLDHGNYGFIGINNKLQYLHELQNAYFLLTKKHLEVNL